MFKISQISSCYIGSDGENYFTAIRRYIHADCFPDDSSKDLTSRLHREPREINYLLHKRMSLATQIP